MDKMIEGYSILRNSGFGNFILEKKTATVNCEMTLKDYEYRQESKVNEISSKENVKPTQIKVTGILRLPYS
ncbi:hypothetical protein ACN92M_07700 [Paenibacillus polymyxa]|uniref:hypothetical protein n=1 Tax=Paenibacillus polymyxa TaxID=1406 RepID=UPI000C9F2440|nr:hypothetical protein [Paenibacillus polymyxa]PNQ86215.1 hypothetical protein C1T20_06115 [Paenibacillus polymyxa]UQQ36842.1 hypothetical protein LMH85_08005 [Paenibacillus polymyxa]